MTVIKFPEKGAPLPSDQSHGDPDDLIPHEGPLKPITPFLWQARYLPRGPFSSNWSTGLAKVDAALDGGLPRPALTVVTGGTGVGKTSLALQIAMAARDRPVVYISFEMSARDLVSRAAAQLTGRPWRYFRRERGSEVGDEATEALHGTNVSCLKPDPKWTIKDELEPALYALYGVHGSMPDVIVDYLQLAARRDNAERDIRMATSKQAEMLQDIACRLDCAVLALSSVPRSFYPGAVKPKSKAGNFLAAGKESGDVEYGAAVVIHLDPTDFLAAGERSVALRIEKNRYGPLATIPLLFNGAVGGYREVEEQEVKAAVPLTPERVVRAVAEGADTRNKLCDKLGGRKGAVLRFVGMLVGSGALISDKKTQKLTCPPVQ